jgi:hypothetical protein
MIPAWAIGFIIVSNFRIASVSKHISTIKNGNVKLPFFEIFTQIFLFLSFFALFGYLF